MEIKYHTIKQQMGQKKSKEIRKYLVISENENTIFHNFWEAVKQCQEVNL